MTLRGLVIALSIVVAAIVSVKTIAADEAVTRHVVMISIDGLKPSTYTQPGPSKAPALRSLAQ